MLLAACVKFDTTPPDIYHPTLSANQEITAGDTLALDFMLVDNRALSHYLWQWEPDSSDHPQWLGQYLVPPFQYYVTGNLSGNTVQLKQILPVPDSVAAGAYLFRLEATDQAGNTGRVTIPLKIASDLDAEAPRFHSPFVPDSVSINATFWFSDSLTDNQQLGLLELKLEPLAGSGSLYLLDFFLTGTQATGPWTIVAPAQPGTYRLTATLRDWINNKSTWKKNIVIE